MDFLPWITDTACSIGGLSVPPGTTFFRRPRGRIRNVSHTRAPVPMHPLQQFELDLAALIGRPTNLRPFVCDGSPLTCDAFIVGFNPASASSTDFWEFWKPGYGFNKLLWFESYLHDRQAKPLKPGRTRRNPISNTRKVIELVIEAAQPVRCLETNIYAAASEEAKDLSEHRRITAPFDFLLATVQPKVIVAHGKDATAHVRNRAPNSAVIESNHFSRGFSNVAAVELGRRIAEKARDG